jgi:hypothetical protein
MARKPNLIDHLKTKKYTGVRSPRVLQRWDAPLPAATPSSTMSTPPPAHVRHQAPWYVALDPSVMSYGSRSSMNLYLCHHPLDLTPSSIPILTLVSEPG